MLKSVDFPTKNRYGHTKKAHSPIKYSAKLTKKARKCCSISIFSAFFNTLLWLSYSVKDFYTLFIINALANAITTFRTCRYLLCLLKIECRYTDLSSDAIPFIALILACIYILQNCLPKILLAKFRIKRLFNANKVPS